jgi:hypothetical protein
MASFAGQKKKRKLKEDPQGAAEVFHGGFCA